VRGSSDAPPLRYPHHDREVRTRFVWSALSSASHVHGYELPPTSKELRDWCDAVGDFLAV
jgi:hypothetical protein